MTAGSLAQRTGLVVGDQILEVCGINLRTAKYAQAAQVLHRTGKTLDIKVQYQPDKFPECGSGESLGAVQVTGLDRLPGSSLHCPALLPSTPPHHQSTPLREPPSPAYSLQDSQVQPL